MSNVDEKLQMKKKKRYVYLDKYEAQVDSINRELKSLKTQVLRCSAAVVLLSLVLIIKFLHIL